MSVNILLEVGARILFSFTRNVTEHYNPEEPEYTAESFEYDPLLSTGREWYYPPADELIYQEYRDKESTASYFAFTSVKIKSMDACSHQQSDDEPEDERNRAMAWKIYIDIHWSLDFSVIDRSFRSNLYSDVFYNLQDRYELPISGRQNGGRSPVGKNTC